MAEILDGKKLKKEIEQVLSAEVSAISEKGLPLPKLVIVRIGNNSASKTYVSNKIQFARAIGAQAVEEWRDENSTTEEIVHIIQKLNDDDSVHGIIVQMPLPAHVNVQKVLNSIHPLKDVDGLGQANMHSLLMNTDGLRPATIQGILYMCRAYNIELKSKKVLVIGRSLIVGKPLALALINENATVTLAHSHSRNMEQLVHNADIVMVATGQPRMIKQDWVKPEHIIFDIGINKDEEGVIGDVSEAAREVVKAYTPVPGGVGQLTVASLLANVLKAYAILTAWKQ